MENLQSALNRQMDLKSVIQRLASIDPSDALSAARTISEVQTVFNQTPAEFKSLKQYAPVIAIYKTKLNMITSNLRSMLLDTYSIRGNAVSINPHACNVDEFWANVNLLDLTSVFVDITSKQLIASILTPLCASGGAQITVQSTEFEWSFAQSSTLKDHTFLPSCVQSFFAFLQANFPASILHDLTRRCWSFAGPALKSNAGKITEALVELESNLLENAILPPDTPRRFQGGWAVLQSARSEAELAAALSTIRARLLSDVNQKSVVLKIPSSAGLQTYLPTHVSAVAVEIAANYIRSSVELTRGVLSIFVLLRHPQFADPKAVNVRNAALFFNDCVYLTLAMSLAGRTEFLQDIMHMRRVGMDAMSHFIRGVVERSTSHIARIDGGLVEQKQTSIAEMAIEDCMRELSECVSEWTTLEVDKDVQNVWLTVVVDAVVARMNSVAVTNANIAIAAAKSGRNFLSSSTVVVKSGIWAVFRKFTGAMEKIATHSVLDTLASWTVAVRIKMALCGGQIDIAALEPLLGDMVQYGVNQNEFEALLLCNPLLQGVRSDEMHSLAAHLMEPSEDRRGFSPRNDTNQGGVNYAALFS